jgi:aspartyl-tRNA synthetase
METMSGLKRTHTCGALRPEAIGQQATLMGWVHRRRNLGGLIFIDLRDREGITQVVFNPQHDAEVFKKAENLKNEWVIAVTGEVEKRPEGTENAKEPTGQVELVGRQLRVLNAAKTLPFNMAEGDVTDDNVRMKYRYIDLRRPKMQQRIIMRHKAVKAIRDYLDSQRFLEIETPVLVRSTPEGARDYLVPSRVNHGKFYALPQSPQLFKQLLMVSGLERYFQIARCFRDEDLRADRQPEFTQLDLEMSFVEQEDVFDIIEGTLAHVFKTCLNLELPRPFPRVPYYEAIDKYGSDKPDTRFDMAIFDVTETLAGTDFGAFKDKKIKGITVPGQANASRKETDEWTAQVKAWGASGLFAVGYKEDGVKSSISKYLNDSQVAELRRIASANDGDLVLLMAETEAKKLCEVLGKLRLDLARKLKLIPSGVFKFLWVLNFPQFAWNDEEQRLEAEHHPFTSPLSEDIPLMLTGDRKDKLKVRSSAYDIVLNGNELGSGSIRIHQRELQEQVFAAIGLGKEEANQKFGFLMEAFEYGAPPHGGIALGVDRLTAIMSGTESIREVIAFPKNQNAVDMLTGAPVEPSPDQLDLLRIAVLPDKKKAEPPPAPAPSLV